MYIYIYIYTHQSEMWCDTINSQNEIWHWTNDKIGVVGSKCELNSWPDSSVG